MTNQFDLITGDSYDITLHNDDVVATIIFECDGASSDPPAKVVYQELLSDKGRELCKGIRAGQGVAPSMGVIVINAKYLAALKAKEEKA